MLYGSKCYAVKKQHGHVMSLAEMRHAKQISVRQEKIGKKYKYFEVSQVAFVQDKKERNQLKIVQDWNTHRSEEQPC